MGSRFLITGGSGFLGINLTRYLLQKGHSVRIFDREGFDYPESRQIEFTEGDIRNFEQTFNALDGIETVVHAAAALPLYPRNEIITTDIDGTRNVLEASFRRNIKRFIHISSTAVYGIPHQHPLTEEDNLVGVGPYGLAKIEAEKLCAEYRKKGMCIPVIRPKSFIGPERLGVFALFYDWAKDGKNFPLPGNGRNRYQLLDVEDLCEAIYLVSGIDGDKANDVFNIGAKEFKTMREDFQAVLEYAGYGKRIILFPAAPLVAVLRVLEFFRLSPLYMWVYETAFRDSFVSIEKAEKELGFTPKYSNQDALIRNYKWYLANIQDFENKAGVSHRVPWKQGFLKFFKIFF